MDFEDKKYIEDGLLACENDGLSEGYRQDFWNRLLKAISYDLENSYKSYHLDPNTKTKNNFEQVLSYLETKYGYNDDKFERALNSRNAKGKHANWCGKLIPNDVYWTILLSYVLEFIDKDLNESINEAFEPWKADAWLNGTRNENVNRMSPENMMAYNNYLDNVAYQALRNNDEDKVMKCINCMRQIYIAAYNRGFNTTAERVNDVLNHRRSELNRAYELRRANNQPQERRGGLFNPEPVEEDLNEEVEIHDTLNPLIWNEDNTLKPEVAQKAKEVAQIFVDILTDNGIKIKVTDIYLVGSNANYNYNEGSDIDIHLIADPSLDCNDQHLKLIYDAYKTLFNRKYDISFKGINVEVYVELGNPSISGGVYSIRYDKWITEPDRNNIPEIDQEAVGQGLTEWTTRYEEITASPTIEEIDNYIDELYNLRINSIANEGEFGTGNLIFKEVRRNGILDKLKELKTELENKQMSLESLIEKIMTTTGKIIL